MEKTFIPTETKVAIINQLSRAGLSKIETTSFVNPKVIPQMQDAEEVMASIDRNPATTYTALVANARGAERALSANVDAIRLVICATDTYNLRNARRTVVESVEDFGVIAGVARGVNVPVEVAIGVAFGCPLEGPVSEDSVAKLAGQVAEIGAEEVSIADSLGFANPVQVRRLMNRLRRELPTTKLSLHIHNTRGLGLANVLAALEEGIDTFDAALGGLGGCPVVPNATGNISTEDLVNMLSEMGIETGVDVHGVMSASGIAQDFLGRRLPSYVLSAGTREDLFHQIEETRSVAGAAN